MHSLTFIYDYTTARTRVISVFFLLHNGRADDAIDDEKTDKQIL